MDQSIFPEIFSNYASRYLVGNFLTRVIIMRQTKKQSSQIRKKQSSQIRQTVNPLKYWSRLTSYALTASVAAVVMGGANSAEAGIITGRYEPPVVAGPRDHEIFSIPVTIDYGIQWVINDFFTSPSLYFSDLDPGLHTGLRWMRGGDGTRLFIDPGVLIDGSADYFSVGQSGTLAGGNNNLPARAGFVGFKVYNASTNNRFWYGWLAVTVTGNQSIGFTTTITEFGYDNTGSGIIAGFIGSPIPEPSGLAMVALGGLAVAGRRWRRIGQKVAA
jgi:hypothetical protein